MIMPFDALIKAIKSAIAAEPTTSTPIIEEEDYYLDKDLDRALKIQEIKTKKEFATLLKQNREERKKYAQHIFFFTCLWSTVIFGVILLSGWKKHTDFDLSDKVLITLITSTTINFFGFFLLVVKYLFHTGDSDKEKKKDKPKPPKKEKQERGNKNEEEES